MNPLKCLILQCRLGLAYLKLLLILYLLLCTGLQTYQWYQSANQLWIRMTTVQQTIATPFSFLRQNSNQN